MVLKPPSQSLLNVTRSYFLSISGGERMMVALSPKSGYLCCTYRKMRVQTPTSACEAEWRPHLFRSPKLKSRSQQRLLCAGLQEAAVTVILCGMGALELSKAGTLDLGLLLKMSTCCHMVNHVSSQLLKRFSFQLFQEQSTPVKEERWSLSRSRRKRSWVKVLMSKVLWKLLGSCHKCLKSWLRQRLATRADPAHNPKAPSDKIIFDLVLSSCLKLLPLKTSSLLSVSPSEGPYLNANVLLTQYQSLVYHISLSHPGKMELGRVSTNERQGERDVPEHVWGVEMRVVVGKQSILGSEPEWQAINQSLPAGSGGHTRLLEEVLKGRLGETLIKPLLHHNFV